MIRPSYHVTAPQNWLNDPNGPLHFNGRYHLFFQHNPDAPRWGTPRWGHVSSPDLVHWRRHADALRPTPGGPDRDGCWSGCGRVIDGAPTLFYTGVTGTTDEDRVESVCRATSTDAFTWTSHPQPLIAGPPQRHSTGFHRDPFVWRDGATWHLLVGSGIAKGGERAGAVLHYTSFDLTEWRYRGVAFERPASAGPAPTGPLWECPQLVRFDDADVLIVSVNCLAPPLPLHRVAAFIGRFDTVGFEPRALDQLDHGDLFYAAAVLEDRGRWLHWGWIQDPAPTLKAGEDSVVGALSLPRTLDLVGDRVRAAPVAGLEVLRTASTVADLHLDIGDANELALPGFHAEVEAAAAGSGVLRLMIAATGSDASQAVDATVDLGHRTLRFTGPRWSPDERRGSTTSLPAASGPVDVRLFIDAGIVELFVGGVSCTSRLPATNRDVRVRVAAERAPIRLAPLTVHALAASGIIGDPAA